MNKEYEKVFTSRGFTNIEQMATMFDYYKDESERYKNIIDKTAEYTKRFTNGKYSRIDTFENVELVLETILQILKGA